MGEVLIAETCPVCNERKYVKKGEKLECCPVPAVKKGKSKPAETEEVKSE